MTGQERWTTKRVLSCVRCGPIHPDDTSPDDENEDVTIHNGPVSLKVRRRLPSLAEGICGQEVCWEEVIPAVQPKHKIGPFPSAYKQHGGEDAYVRPDGRHPDFIIRDFFKGSDWEERIEQMIGGSLETDSEDWDPDYQGPRLAGDDDDPGSQAYDAARWEQRVADEGER